MMRKKIGIGQSDYKNLLDGNCYYIDKTLLIKELIDSGSQVMLFPRPRRFGKTLNLSMLRYYFEKTEKDNSYLFKNYAIWNQGTEYIGEQGKYSIIYLTFKDIKQANWEETYNKIIELISEEYLRHDYLKNVLKPHEKEEYNKIEFKTAKKEEYEASLRKLSNYLEKYHNEKVMILIDEYDTPIQAGYVGKYYDEIVSFMRGLLSGALKDNSSLEKGILTGILRVAKESIFSGLNNLKVSTILDKQYGEYFGLLEKEVEEILKFFEKEYKIEDIRDWYNGYLFGDSVVYNPWSIINSVDDKDNYLKPHWVNTSSNDIIKQIITRSGKAVKQELEELIEGKSITKQINESIVFGDIEKSSDTIWSFLLFSGYLKAENIEMIEELTLCDLSIPNNEVRYLYKEIIMSWFNESIYSDKLEMMLKALTLGDTETFEDVFSEFVSKTFSYFDPSGDYPENLYHGFVLGLLISLNKTHEVKSNRESGFGRYDVMLIPKEVGNRQACSLGIIIEFKKVNKKRGETLEKAADNAIDQIEKKAYRTELINRGIKNVLSLGIAFEGKEIMMREKRNIYQSEGA